MILNKTVADPPEAEKKTTLPSIHQKEKVEQDHHRSNRPVSKGQPVAERKAPTPSPKVHPQAKCPPGIQLSSVHQMSIKKKKRKEKKGKKQINPPQPHP
jgi:hypothetical protein